MKHIKITGACTSTSQHHALRLYRKHAGRGRHTVMFGISERRNSLTERRMSMCDVLITVHRDGGPLTIEETTTCKSRT
jgi:hypothetical protein